MSKEMKNGAGEPLSLSGVIDRFEGDFAVIKTGSGRQILWPIEKLPDDTGEGEAVKLFLVTEKTETAEKEKTAKAVLDEILQTDHEQ